MELRMEIEALDKEVRKLEGEAQQLQQNIEKSKQQVGQLQQQLNQLALQIIDKKGELRGLIRASDKAKPEKVVEPLEKPEEMVGESEKKE